MTTADEMRQIAQTLEHGVRADIWAWFDESSDYLAPGEAATWNDAVTEAQAAMTRAAALLRQLADPTRPLTDTERAVLRGMLP